MATVTTHVCNERQTMDVTCANEGEHETETHVTVIRIRIGRQETKVCRTRVNKRLNVSERSE